MRSYTYVFGSTGYIGSELIKSLKSDPHLDPIICFIHHRLPSPDMEGIRCIPMKITEIDEPFLNKFSPSNIYHLARFGASKPMLRHLSSNRGYTANQGLLNLLEKMDRKISIHYVSGSLMYGNVSAPIDESATLSPTGFAVPYFKGESPFLSKGKPKISIHMYRPGWILGPDSWFKQFFWNPYLKTNKVPFYGSGDQQMSIISLADCARLINHGSRELATDEDLNIVGYNHISQREFSELIANQLNTTTTQVKEVEMKNSLDAHTIEALLSNTPLKSARTNVYANFSLKDNSLNNLIKETIHALSSSSKS